MVLRPGECDVYRDRFVVTARRIACISATGVIGFRLPASVPLLRPDSHVRRRLRPETVMPPAPGPWNTAYLVPHPTPLIIEKTP